MSLLLTVALAAIFIEAGNTTRFSSNEATILNATGGNLSHRCRHVVSAEASLTIKSSRTPRAGRRDDADKGETAEREFAL